MPQRCAIQLSKPVSSKMCGSETTLIPSSSAFYIMDQEDVGNRDQPPIATTLKYSTKCWATFDSLSFSCGIRLPLSTPEIVIIKGAVRIIAMLCGGDAFMSQTSSEGSPATKRCRMTRFNVQLSETVRTFDLKAMVGIVRERRRRLLSCGGQGVRKCMLNFG